MIHEKDNNETANQDRAKRQEEIVYINSATVLTKTAPTTISIAGKAASVGITSFNTTMTQAHSLVSLLAQMKVWSPHAAKANMWPRVMES